MPPTETSDLSPAIKRQNLALLAAARAGDAKVDSRDSEDEGLTAPMLAAIHGHDRCLAILIHAATDIDAKDDDGHAACAHAANNSHPKRLAALLAADAQPLLPWRRRRAKGSSASLDNPWLFCQTSGSESKTKERIMIEHTHAAFEKVFSHRDAPTLAPARTATIEEVEAYRQEQLAIAMGERPEVTKMYESIYRCASGELDLQDGIAG